jgi:hypothetical protein
MPDFVPVLIAAVFILVVLLLAFGGSFLITGGTGGGGGEDTSRTILLGQDLTVSYNEGQKDAARLGGEASQGLFSNVEQTAEFALDNYQDATEGIIKLNVWKSNYYGYLIVTINGQLVYQGAPNIGEKTITFDGSVFKPSNVIEIEAESSGWKIWAPDIYIFNASLSVNYIGRMTQRLSFDLSSADVSSIKRARLLIFGTRSGPGQLTATMNGREIYSGYTTAYTDFSSDNLVAGNNTLELSTEKNTAYNISSAQIVVFY